MAYNENPLLFDYYGFPKQMYEIEYKSKGSPPLADKIVNLLKQNSIPAKTIPKGRGLDHGVFIPFMFMFPSPCPIPIIEVSMPSDLDPTSMIKLGNAVRSLRSEDILILSGGLTVHSFEELNSFDPQKAPKAFHDWENDIMKAAEEPSTTSELITSLVSLTKHKTFRRAHPREDHFVPLYIALGAGVSKDEEENKVAKNNARVISRLYGAISIAFL